MENPDERPLYTLTIGEFKTLVRQVVCGVIDERLSAISQVAPTGEDTKEETHFTIKELTKFLHCSRMSIHNYKKLGLPFYRLGRKILFKKNEVLEFMRKCLGRDRIKTYN